MKSTLKRIMQKYFKITHQQAVDLLKSLIWYVGTINHTLLTTSKKQSKVKEKSLILIR